MQKITVIGAGNVGAACANMLAHKNLFKEVILVDIKPGLAEGKALDIWQTSSINNFDTQVIGVTDDYDRTANSDVVIITSGIPRGPGMSRDDLIKTNAVIVKTVTEKAVVASPDAIIIVVSNPLDVMTYAAQLASGKSNQKVFGQAGILDTGRYNAFIAEALDVSPNDVQSILLGGHGDTMVPLPRLTTVGGVPLNKLLDDETSKAIVQRARVGGGEIVKLLGTSAWHAPGAAAALMAEAVLTDKKKIVPVSVRLDGEYGLKDVYLGVPVVLGKDGIEKVIELDLTEDELVLLHKSANAVKTIMKVLDDMNLF